MNEHNSSRTGATVVMLLRAHDQPIEIMVRLLEVLTMADRTKIKAGLDKLTWEC